VLRKHRQCGSPDTPIELVADGGREYKLVCWRWDDRNSFRVIIGLLATNRIVSTPTVVSVGP